MVERSHAGLMIRRSLGRACPRCGSKRIFSSYWSIRDRCPRCGLSFAREPGYFTGVYLLNLSFILVALFVLVMAYAIARANGLEPDLTTAIGVGIAVSVIVPILTYPFARVLWSALDLAMMPLELDEIADAATAALHEIGDDPPEIDDPRGRDRA